MMAWQAVICATGLVLTVPAMAMADSARFDIAAQPMPAALKAFAAQAHMQLLYQYGAVAHATGNAVVGELETHAALEQLLRNTGLEVVYSSPNAATIRPLNSSTRSSGDAGSRAAGQEPSQESPSQDGPQHKSFWDRFRLAQADQGQTSSPSAVEKHDEQASKKKPIQLEEVIVTGSRIPTVAGQGPQEVKVYTREQIDESGQTTAADFLNTLPDVSVSVGE
ncbi:MAG TPA: STN domain-containing protein, partial [Steroidobacteraceae bacterium]|nr:STN domain-containing protein [Steroidobacteraceae bacterium]